MKTAFLILGAQRSGTSVISHILSKFGISFADSKRLIQGGHNPIFFELKWLNDANNEILRCLGHQDIDFFLPVEAEFESEAVFELEPMLEKLVRDEWGESTAIALKDPRFSLTLPVWQRGLTQLGYQLRIILAFRCLAGFLASNKKHFQNREGWNDQRHLYF